MQEDIIMKAAYLDAARAAIMAYMNSTDYPCMDVIIAIIMGTARKGEE